MTEKDKKIDNALREIFIYPYSVVLFPFMTVRVLVWKWLIWLQKCDDEIEKKHSELNSP